MSCTDRRMDLCLDRDEDFALTVYLQADEYARRWRAGRAVAEDDLLLEDRRVLECTTAGDSGSTEPAWDTLVDIGDTIADGTAEWAYIAPSGGAQLDDLAKGRDLTGLTVKAWIWDADGVELFALTVGDGIEISASETCPADDRGRATGTGPRADIEVSEAGINALSAAVLAQKAWTYKVRISDSGDDDDGEVLAWGSITLTANARPRA